MPSSQEKAPEQATELPNPDLNPLLNPTLGRHLGRWAQVYFTSPPEKREEAIGELLRELEGQPAPEQSAPPEAIRIVEDIRPRVEVVRCGYCGHESTNPQRFCGMCGASFASEATTSGDASVSVVPGTVPPTLAEQRLSEQDLEVGDLASESGRSHDDAFADVPWLREKSNVDDAPSSLSRMARRYAPAIVAILAIGILFYAQSRPRAKQPRATNQTTAAQNQSEGAARQAPTWAQTDTVPGHSEPQPSSASARAQTPTRSTPEPATAAVPKEAVQLPASAPVEDRVRGSGVPATPLANAASQVLSGPTLSATNGSVEVAQAEDLLSGRTRLRNSTEAAQLLWRAVGKENPSAILMLSDLYLVGDGVPKSCDQARLLLTAAARKGVPQAAEKLRDLLRTGCPK